MALGVCTRECVLNAHLSQALLPSALACSVPLSPRPSEETLFLIPIPKWGGGATETLSKHLTSCPHNCLVAEPRFRCRHRLKSKFGQGENRVKKSIWSERTAGLEERRGARERGAEGLNGSVVRGGPGPTGPGGAGRARWAEQKGPGQPRQEFTLAEFGDYLTALSFS